MATIKTPALVTRTMNWRDSSRIVTLFTREHGRTDVIAKGANRMGGPLAGILEPLNLIEAVVYVSEKRELQLLARAELETAFAGIRQDLEKTGYALGMLEILNIFFKDHGPAADFYDFTVHLLGAIERGGQGLVCFWFFMLKLASYLGFRPEFGSCRICGGAPAGGGAVYFPFASGAVVCSGCAGVGEAAGFRLTAAACGYLAALQRTHYQKIGAVRPPQAGGAEITGFLQAYLRWHTSEKLELKALDYYRL